MKQNPSRTSKPSKDGMAAAAREQADWPLEQVRQLALELYVRFPFDDEDTERWKDLAREAFWVFDNLDEACEEVLRERSEDRRAAARETDAYKRLPAMVPFESAVRYITGEKRPDRAERKFNKISNYEARIVPFEGVSPKLSTKQKKQLQQLRAQLKKWRTNGIRRQEAIQLQSRYEAYWRLIVAEQNSAKVRKRAKRTDRRRGARTPGELGWTPMPISEK
jgi:hypothetical protein